MTIAERIRLNEAKKVEAGHCLANSAPDEPVFVLCARDVTAPDIVRLWAVNAASRGVSSRNAARHARSRMRWNGGRKNTDPNCRTEVP